VIRIRAAWVVPIAAPPIRNGWVDVDDAGRIAGLGADASRPADLDLGHAALMPGVVNAHTHLELSHLRGRIPASDAFVSWVRGVMRHRRGPEAADAGEILRGIASGIADSLRCGTAVVGDISNTLAAYPALASSAISGVVFYELIRFNAPTPESVVGEAWQRIDALPPSTHVRVRPAAHAPYSVAPSVFAALGRSLAERSDRLSSVHLAESRDESEFIAGGTGEWRAFLDEVGSWNPAWRPAAVSPVQYLDDLGFITDRTLAVHGVQMTTADLSRLARRGATLVTCPRSNANTGAGTPPIDAFYASGVKIALGTDSLASTPDLNVFAEMAAIRRLGPRVRPAAILDSATRQGARALGFADDFGTIEAGKRGRLLAVAIPAGLTDVEEYLVSGIEPGQLRWVDPLE
jgi:cytosine/adenosine deaminase-related metal-dependent hydrolase